MLEAFSRTIISALCPRTVAVYLAIGVLPAKPLSAKRYERDSRTKSDWLLMYSVRDNKPRIYAPANRGSRLPEISGRVKYGTPWSSRARTLIE